MKHGGVICHNVWDRFIRQPLDPRSPDLTRIYSVVMVKTYVKIEGGFTSRFCKNRIFVIVLMLRWSLKGCDAVLIITPPLEADNSKSSCETYRFFGLIYLFGSVSP